MHRCEKGPPSSHLLSANPAWTGLFPSSVVTVTQAELADTPALMPEERSFLARAVPARVLEFTTGRSCARAALAQLGCPPVAIAVGDRREPIWPPGFIGSITHCKGHCAAAAARWVARAAHAIASLGLDAEPARPLPEDVARRVCSDGEREWIEQHRQDGLPWDRLVFSAKESVFKCIFPVARCFLDFHDVELAFLDERTFQIRAPSLPEATKHVRGSYAFREGFILTTAIWLARGQD
jgi:4'-phosphopantetheinyl transferase EntD